MLRGLIMVLAAASLQGCVVTQEQLALQARLDDAACRSRSGADAKAYSRCRLSQQQAREAAQAAALANAPTNCSRNGDIVYCY